MNFCRAEADLLGAHRNECWIYEEVEWASDSDAYIAFSVT